MILNVKRDLFNAKQTIGKLFIDGKFETYTLEDTMREVEGEAVAIWKIQNETAIPRGRYDVIINWSAHFKKFLPLLLNVPGFEGVRIHSGNTELDTEGCILVGDIRFNTYIGASRIAANRVQNKIQAALDRKDTVQIIIE